MLVKIDTKEKFTVIEAEETNITANMTDELVKLLLPFLEQPIPHVIFNAQKVQNIDQEAARALFETQQQFHDQNASFVFCCLQEAVTSCFEEMELLDHLNHTPTESEAWDIVQMEEIERELLSNWDDTPEA